MNRKTFALEYCSIDDNLQSKHTTNGKEDISSYLTSTDFTHIKARIHSLSESHLTALSSDPRQLALYQTISHYHDLLYASDVEPSASCSHNKMLLQSLALHVVNHSMKVCERKYLR